MGTRTLSFGLVVVALALVGAVATAQTPPATDARGSLTKEVIRRVIERHISEVAACYQHALETRASLQGRIVVNFIIAPTGAVQGAAINQGLSAPELEACLLARVKTWRFPAPVGGGIVVVNYPFIFNQPNVGAQSHS